MTALHPSRVLVVWNGLPAYAASCLAAAGVGCQNASIDIWGVLPSPTQAFVDEILGGRVRWTSSISFDDEAFGKCEYDATIVSGWHEPICLEAARVAKNHGAWTVTMIDNRWTGSARQVARATYHRLFRSRLFDAAWVPGRAGVRTARALGFPRESIFDGLYGADPKIYTAGPPLESRPKRFLYVGQIIERKNVVELTNAFVRFSQKYPDWELVIYGSGPDRERLANHPRIVVHPFADPHIVARAMQSARFLILPSHEEHWGVVVHEACLAGCGLILSRAIGASEDLATADNCITIAGRGSGAIAIALGHAAAMSEGQLETARRISLARGALFGPQAFTTALDRMLSLARKRPLP